MKKIVSIIITVLLIFQSMPLHVLAGRRYLMPPGVQVSVGVEEVSRQLGNELIEAEHAHLAFLKENLNTVRIVETDHLVIGDGAAGNSAVDEICRRSRSQRIVLLSKGEHGKSTATQHAQEGAVASFESTAQLHVRDTLMVGKGDIRTSRILAEQCTERIKDLMRSGARFDMRKDGRLDLLMKSGMSAAMIVHADGAQTGKEMERAQSERTMRLSKERGHTFIIHDHVFVVDLLLKNGRCVGALGMDVNTGTYIIYRAKATVLCTGGAARVYQRNTNPEFSTGDGYALAWRAGAELYDMELMQIYPTALLGRDEEGRAFLISEAMRGSGGILLNSRGKRFMANHPEKELAPRNIARAIHDQMKKTKSNFVWLDISSIKNIKDEYPGLYEACRERGIDLDKNKKIPVCPAAHFSVGGIKTDEYGRTSIPGLYAAGETASNGLHGYDRKASNSLIEGLVFGEIAGRTMCRDVGKVMTSSIAGGDVPDELKAFVDGTEDEQRLKQINERLGEIMQETAWLIRHEDQLRTGLREVEALQASMAGLTLRTRQDMELRNKLAVSEMILRGALFRKESAGVHFREDGDTLPDNKWFSHTVFTRGKKLFSRDIIPDIKSIRWLFSMPRKDLTGPAGSVDTWYFDMDTQLAQKPELFFKAVRGDIVPFVLSDGFKKIAGNVDIGKLLGEGFEKTGYISARTPGALKPGEYRYDPDTNPGVVFVRLLLNTGKKVESSEIHWPFHRFPLWLVVELKKRLLRKPGFNEEMVNFIFKDSGIGFVGIVNDIPEAYLPSLQPRQYAGAVIIYEGILDEIAEVFKDLMPRYDAIELEEVKEEVRKTILFFSQVEGRILDSGADFTMLAADLLKAFGEGSYHDWQFRSLIQGIRRQYGYRTHNAEILLRELVVHFIIETVLFGKLPRLREERNMEPPVSQDVCRVIRNFIVSNGIYPEGTLRVALDKINTCTLVYQDNTKKDVVLSGLLLSKGGDHDLRLNDLKRANKIEMITKFALDPSSYVWMDDEWHELYGLYTYFIEKIQSLKTAITNQLGREISITAEDILTSLYGVEDSFMFGNIIREIYFGGRNPHVSSADTFDQELARFVC